MATNDGGPAFPRPIYPALYDFFAAFALAGILASPSMNLMETSARVGLAYVYADCMLAEREKRNART